METLFKNVLFSDGIGGVKMAEKTLKLNKNDPEWHWSAELLIHRYWSQNVNSIASVKDILDSW